MANFTIGKCKECQQRKILTITGFCSGCAIERANKASELSAKQQAREEPVGFFALDKNGEVFWNG